VVEDSTNDPKMKSLNPAADSGRKKKRKKNISNELKYYQVWLRMTIYCSTMVEYSTDNQKIKSYNPAAGSRREKNRKKYFK
jgi:hypothetical protein